MISLIARLCTYKSQPPFKYLAAKLARLFRYSPALLLALFYSFSSFALEYSWHKGNTDSDRAFQSADAACKHLAETATLNYGELIAYEAFLTRPGYAWCYYTYSRGGFFPGQTFFGTSHVYRKGDSCPPNMRYNATTGACAKDEEKGPPPPGGCAGNPINIAVGNKFQAETDYQSTSAPALRFSRAYNSLDGLWRHNFSTRLRISNTNISLVMSNGQEYFFIRNGLLQVTAEPTIPGVLISADKGWLYIAENNDRFTFNENGRLTHWMNSAGVGYQLTYDNGTVIVTDNHGRSLSFTEDTQHQPLSLSVSGLKISYRYNANKHLDQLTRSRNGQTEERTFHYEDPRNNALLTGITDERGVRYASWSYDDQGRAISSEHAGGAEETSVNYNADGSSTVTNEFGKKATYRFQQIGGVKRITAIEGEPSANCPNSNSTFTYDERGLLKTKTDNKGHLTTYAYNERGLEVSRTEASGTPQARTISTEWHPTLFLPLTVTEPNRITTYTYDAQGRQLSQTRTAL